MNTKQRKTTLSSYSYFSSFIIPLLSLCSVLLWTTYLSFPRSLSVSLLRQIWTPYIKLNVLVKLHTNVPFSRKVTHTMSLFIEDLRYIWNMLYIQPTAWMMNLNSSRLRVKSLKAGRDLKGWFKSFRECERKRNKERESMTEWRWVSIIQI